MRRNHFYQLILGITLLGFVWQIPLSSSFPVVMTSKWASEFRPYGAYVDEIEFVLFTEWETVQAISALQNGDIDAYDKRVLVDYVVPLFNNENITVTFTLSVRYEALTLNCERFPLNITAFRRAMAFGYDKYSIDIDGMHPDRGQPQDSYIPLISTEWSVEAALPVHFYEGDFIEGNKSLDNAGFKDVDDDGWREYVDKDTNAIIYEDNAYADGGILELYALAEDDWAILLCKIMVNGLEAMGIRTMIVEMDSASILTDIHDGNYWISNSYHEVDSLNPPVILYDYFRSGQDYNTETSRFSNSTIDTILDSMMAATTLEEAKEKAAEASILLAFEQPMIVICNGVNIGAFYNNRFEGWFEFEGSNIAPFEGGWTSGDIWAYATKVHLKEDLGGPWGGTFKYCLSDNMGTLNPYLLTTKYEETVFQYIYERLWNIDPITWDPIPGLAYNWQIEQTSANGDVRNGQKFIFYLYENETWHDGEPFTASDVNHSLHLWRSSSRSGPEMADVYKVAMPDGPDGHIIELYVNKTGHFEWRDTTRFYITPEHIWGEITNVSAFIPTNDQIIGTGPYKWNEYVPGESISLLRHEDWRWALQDMLPSSQKTSEEVSTTLITTSKSSTAEDTPGFPLFMVLTIIFSILYYKHLKRKFCT